MKYLSLLLLLSSLTYASDISNNDISFEQEFLEGLEEISEIATKTKLNIDDSPSFVSLLHSSRLKQLGITNLFEALSLVPGVQLKREASGVPVVIFRGVSQKGEVKLMVDGVTINNNYRGSIYHYLDFPIEMIKRIEVIRGAGSVLYGSGAISGVINIITNASQKDSTNTLFTSANSDETYKGGGLVSTDIGDFKLTLDAYYLKSDKTVEDMDRHTDDYSVGINLSDGHITLLARVKRDDIGNAYGILKVKDTSRNEYNNENNSLITQLSYSDSLGQNNHLSLYAGYSRYGQNVEAAHPKIPTIDAEYRESSAYTQADLINSSLQDNELLIGIKYESATTIKSEWSTANPISDPDFSRDTLSLYLNNQYGISSDLDISAGLRYDNYSDFGDSFSPNLGLVYRVTPKVRFKALYSHAFRAPSWVELTSNPDLVAESSDSFEAGLIFKQNQNHLVRVNFYVSQINDMITKEATYVQNSKNNFYGSELEYLYAPTRQAEINLIASYINAKDNEKNDLVDIANILASASFTYKLDMGINFGSLLKYISSSKRSDIDIRDDFSSTLIFDQTISYYYKGFKSSLVIKDLFDQEIHYALPQNSDEIDFNDGGRSVILNIAMEF